MALLHLLQVALLATVAGAVRIQPAYSTRSMLVTANSSAVTVANSAADPNGGYFTMFGTTTVAGIHTALTTKKTVIIIDRTDVVNSRAKLANGQVSRGRGKEPKP